MYCLNVIYHTTIWIYISYNQSNWWQELWTFVTSHSQLMDSWVFRLTSVCLNENDYCCKLRICSGENNGERLCSTSVRNCQRKTEVRHALDFVSINLLFRGKLKCLGRRFVTFCFWSLLSDSRGAFPTAAEREGSEDSSSLFSLGLYYWKRPNPRILL